MTISRTHYNLAAEAVNLSMKFIDQNNERINKALDILENYNSLLSTFSQLNATLNARKNNGTHDFTNHEVRVAIDKLFHAHPELFSGFEDNLYTGWDKDRIERVIAGADPIIRNYTALVSQGTMKLQVCYSDQEQIMRNLDRIVEEDRTSKRSIVSNFVRGG